VRSGNLDKFKLHVESDHDVFYDHDILIAINFLEAHEKEVIIEKVLPRMKLLFDNVHSLNGKFAIGHKLPIEKRLLEDDESVSGNPAKKTKPNESEDAFNDEVVSSIEHKLNCDNDEIDIGDKSDNIPNKDYDDDDDSEAENDAVSVGETLAESIKSVKEILTTDNKESKDEFTSCDVCNLSVRKSIFDFHRKSHLSAAKTTTECDICRKVMQKKSMYKHRRRCEIMNMSRNNSLADGSNERDSFVNDPTVENNLEEESVISKLEERNVIKTSTSEGESQCYICKKPMLKGNIRRHIRMVHTSELDFKCKICFTGFQQLDSLKFHTNKEHNLELEDVEQMLEENGDNNASQVNVENQSPRVKLDPEILEKVMNSAEHDRSVEKPEASDDKKYKCDRCENVYTNKDSVRRHMRKSHFSMLDV